MKPKLISTFLLFILFQTTTSFAQEPFKIWNSWEKVAELPFTKRDGVGVVHFKNEIWMMGGWAYGPDSNEIYKSSDGINWIKVGNGTWQGRHGAGMVAFKDKLWVLSGDGIPDIWSSEDGIDWILEVDHAPWGRRYTPYITVFDDKMWLMGGVSYWDETGFYSQSFEKAFNDVWSSEDGVNWKRELKNAPWGPRGLIHGSLIHNDEMWILGGGSKNWNVPTFIYNDVWKTKNGIDWELVTEKATWSPRIHFTTISFDNKIWVIDGTTTTESLTNSAWYSEDGIEWHPLESATSFPRTHASTAFAHNNALFISAGFNIDAIYRYRLPQSQHLKSDTPITIASDGELSELSLKLTSGLKPNIQLQDTTIAEIIDSQMVRAKAIGNTKLIVSHSGAYGYYPLDTTYVDLIVKLKQNIIAEALPEAIVQDTVKINILSETGLPVTILPNEYINIIDETTFIPLVPGKVTLELQQDGDDDYASWSSTVDITVVELSESSILRQKQSLVKEISSVTLTYGDDPVALDLASTSGLPLTFQISDTSIASLTTDNRIEIRNAGATKVLVSNEGNSDFYPLFTSVIELVVQKKEQYLIEPMASVNSVYGNAPINLTFETNGGMPLIYSVTDTSVVEVIEGSKLMIKNAGTTELSMSNNGDGNYHPLEPTNININIDKKEQVISVFFPYEISTNETINFNIESDTGLPIKLLPNPGITIVNANTFTPSKSGQLKLTLEQTGNHNYKPWSKEYTMFVISSDGFMVYPNPAKELITLSFNSHLGPIEKINIVGMDSRLHKSLFIQESPSQVEINLVDLHPGVYFVKIILSNGEIKTTKIVKV